MHQQKKQVHPPLARGWGGLTDGNHKDGNSACVLGSLGPTSRGGDRWLWLWHLESLAAHFANCARAWVYFQLSFMVLLEQMFTKMPRLIMPFCFKQFLTMPLSLVILRTKKRYGCWWSTNAWPIQVASGDTVGDVGDNRGKGHSLLKGVASSICRDVLGFLGMQWHVVFPNNFASLSLTMMVWCVCCLFPQIRRNLYVLVKETLKADVSITFLRILQQFLPFLLFTWTMMFQYLHIILWSFKFRWFFFYSG